MRGMTLGGYRTFADDSRFKVQRTAPTSQLAGVGVGAAVFDQWTSAVDSTRRREVNNRGSLRVWDVSSTAKAIGLLHIAAAGGHTEAQLSLGVR